MAGIDREKHMFSQPSHIEGADGLRGRADLDIWPCGSEVYFRAPYLIIRSIDVPICCERWDLMIHQ